VPQYVVLLELSVSPKRGFRHDCEVSAKWAPESLPEEGLHWAWVIDINVLLRSFSCMSHIVKGRQKIYERIFLSTFQPSVLVCSR
jgi:hypothetical protein